jgi:hypothetical protein
MGVAGEASAGFFSFIANKNTEKIDAEYYLCRRIFDRKVELMRNKTDKTIKK